jgi:transmembrane carrier protein
MPGIMGSGGKRRTISSMSSHRFDPPKEQTFTPPNFDDHDCSLIPVLEGSPNFSSIPLQHHHYQHYLQTNFDDIHLPDSYFDFNPPKSHFGKVLEVMKPGCMWAGRRLVGCAVGMPWEISLIVKAIVPKDGESDLALKRERATTTKNPFLTENVWDTPPTSPSLIRDAGGYLAPKPIRIDPNDQLLEVLRLLIDQQGFGCLLRPLGWRWSATIVDELINNVAFLSLYNARLSKYSEILSSCLGRVMAVPLERMVVLRTISLDKSMSFWPHSWTACLLHSVAQPLLEHFVPPLFQSVSLSIGNKYLMQTSFVIMDHLVNALPLIVTIPVNTVRLRLEASSVKAPILPIKRYTSLLDCFLRMIREEGVSALYSGWRWHLAMTASRVLTRHLAIAIDEMHGIRSGEVDHDEDFDDLHE